MRLLYLLFSIVYFSSINSQVRFDGIYVSEPIIHAERQDTSYGLIRFYRDKTVITSSHGNYIHNYTDICKFFNKEYLSKEKKYKSLGQYEIDSTKIKFLIQSKALKSKYDIEIIDSNLFIVHFNNLKTKYQNTNTYHFEKVDFNPSSKDPKPFPQEIKIGDLINIEINYKSCYGAYRTELMNFKMINDSTVQLEYGSYWPTHYRFKKDKDASKEDRREGKAFLKKNNMKLNTNYDVVKFPEDSLKGSFNGLIKHSSLEYRVDSSFYYSDTILKELKTIYKKIIDDSVHYYFKMRRPDMKDTSEVFFTISGLYTEYNFEYIKDKVAQYLMYKRKVHNGYLISIRSKKRYHREIMEKE